MMKSYHGATLDDVKLLKGVLVAKQKMSDRYHLFTIGFQTSTSLNLNPGDHIFIFPESDPQLVNEVMRYLIHEEEDEVVVWNEGKFHCTLHRALTSYLDLTSTPSRDVIQNWIQYTSDASDAKAMEMLSEDPELYREWRHKCPDVSDLFHMFPR